MSGLARVLHDRGKVVTGSDLKASRYATSLQESGITVHVGHVAGNLGDPEVVVVSSAIPDSNPELKAARERGIPVWPRAKMLAHIAGDDACVAVAGTHGKTTTSSMMATVLDSIGLDPTFLIGGELNDMGANARCGGGAYCVVEADESDGSFLYLDPKVSIITNIEADHLDHYGSFEAVVDTFGQFIQRT
ncbi:MAG: UDP-N-acetylmuramate--L-alanine ligase, partial [Coriobacteriia bacterium]|nr:UDP-N-acetylmuramate--L-alanine ligase [Coriobacteriia bacterium]